MALLDFLNDMDKEHNFFNQMNYYASHKNFQYLLFNDKSLTEPFIYASPNFDIFSTKNLSSNRLTLSEFIEKFSEWPTNSHVYSDSYFPNATFVANLKQSPRPETECSLDTRHCSYIIQIHNITTDHTLSAKIAILIQKVDPLLAATKSHKYNQYTRLIRLSGNQDPNAIHLQFSVDVDSPLPLAREDPHVHNTASNDSVHNTAFNGSEHVTVFTGANNHTRTSWLKHAAKILNSCSKSDSVSHVHNILSHEKMPKLIPTNPKLPAFRIHHNSLIHVIWEIFIVFFIFSFAFVTPTFVGYFIFFKDFPFLYIELAFELILLADFFSNFFTTFEDSDNNVITDFGKIRRRYVYKWYFVLDLLSSLPYSILPLVLPKYSIYLNLLCLMKLLRLIHLGRIFSKTNNRLYQYNIRSIFFSMFIFYLLVHIMSCIWFGAYAYIDGSADPKCWLNIIADQFGKINPFLLDDMNLSSEILNQGSIKMSGKSLVVMRFIDAYIPATYFSFTSVTTIGFGNLSANTLLEMIVSTFLMFIGCLMYLLIFTHISMVITTAKQKNIDDHLFDSRTQRHFQRFFKSSKRSKLNSLNRKISKVVIESQTNYSMNVASNPLFDSTGPYIIDRMQYDIISNHINFKLFNSDQTNTKSHQLFMYFPLISKLLENNPFLIFHSSNACLSIFIDSNEQFIFKKQPVTYFFYIVKGHVLFKKSNHDDSYSYDYMILDPGKTFGVSPEMLGQTVVDINLCKSRYDVISLTKTTLFCIDIDRVYQMGKMYPEITKSFRETLHLDFPT